MINPISVTDDINTKIRHAREARKITQVAMAKKLRIARQTYLDLESGKTEPRVSTLEKISEIVRIPICHFLNGTSKTPLDFYSNEELLAEINRRLKPEL